MAKKTKFSKLSLGNEDLSKGLELLNSGTGASSSNPLTDNKQRKSKKPMAKPSKVKPGQVADKLKSTPKTETPEPETLIEEKVAAKEKKQPVTKKKERGEVKKVIEDEKPVVSSLQDTQSQPSDFKSQSLLISEDQLNRVRDKVYKIKASGNRKYTIKDAFFEAFDSFLVTRVPVDEFPSDFVTYSPSISAEQWERMNSQMYSIKVTNHKYAMKYAVYEAIESYLNSNLR